MIIDFYKNYGGGGSGSAVTPADVESAITSALTEYWDSATTKEYVDEAVGSGGTFDPRLYYTSAQTEEAIASALTDYYTKTQTEELISGEVGAVIEQVDRSLRAYYTSAQTEEAITEALEDYYDSAETKTAIAESLEGYYTSAQTDTAIATAIAGKNDATLLKHVNSLPVSAETGDVVALVSGGMADIDWTFGPSLWDTGYSSTYTTPGFFMSETLVDGEPINIASWTSSDNKEILLTGTYSESNGYMLVKMYVDGVEDENARYWLYDQSENEQANYYDNLPTDFNEFDLILHYDETDGTQMEFVAKVLVEGEDAYYNDPLTGIVTFYGIGNGESTIGLYQYDGADWGEVKPDLSAYYTSAETQSAIAQSLTRYYTSAETQEAIMAQSIVDKAYTDNKLTGYYTSAQTDDILTGYTPLADYCSLSAIVQEQQIVFSSGYTELHADFDKYYTSAQTEDAIATALEGYYDSAATDVQIVLALADYYTSAETDTKIATALADYALSADVTTLSAATAGKADAASVTKNDNNYKFPYWNEQGIITGAASTGVTTRVYGTNGKDVAFFVKSGSIALDNIYGPLSAGTPGEILVATGDVPVWGNPLSAYTTTDGFATINGSAITAGGDLVITAETPDLSNYYTSAQTVNAIATALEGYYTSAQTDSIFEGYYTSGQTDTAISTATANMVESTSVSTIWKGTQAEYDTATQSGATADPNTFYIIVANNN